jgi:hypothetical protein
MEGAPKPPTHATPEGAHAVKKRPRGIGGPYGHIGLGARRLTPGLAVALAVWATAIAVRPGCTERPLPLLEHRSIISNISPSSRAVASAAVAGG